MLRENISTAEVRGMLRLKQAEARQLIQAEMERLRRIEARIEQIERGENVSALREVVVKQVEPILAVTLETTASRSDIPELFEELDNHARRYGIVPAAPHIVVWHACPECETNIHLEVAVPFHGEMPSSGPFQVKLLPAVTAASVTHVSRPDTDSPVRLDLGVWIERNGYAIQPDVPSREVYVSHIEGRAGHFVTESLMPIVR
jgi:effector-binding domain-containing protein